VKLGQFAAMENDRMQIAASAFGGDAFRGEKGVFWPHFGPGIGWHSLRLIVIHDARSNRLFDLVSAIGRRTGRRGADIHRCQVVRKMTHARRYRQMRWI
jgi:hypothetical protein